MREKVQSMKPSNATYAGLGIGLPVAIVVSWAMKEFAGVTVPGEVQTAFGCIVSSVVAYFFKGGRSVDTKE